MREVLGGLQEVRLIYPRQQGEKHPRTVSCLSERDAGQDKLLDALNLGRYQSV